MPGLSLANACPGGNHIRIASTAIPRCLCPAFPSFTGRRKSRERDLCRQLFPDRDRRFDLDALGAVDAAILVADEAM